MARRERCHARHPGSHAMTPHQFRPGDTAYALADGLDTTKGRGYRVHYTGSNGRLLWLHGGVNVRRWHESRDFSPTPPAKETTMETTPKAGDEMKVVVASTSLPGSVCM